MKSILFSSKCTLKLLEELDVRYKEIKIKQHKLVNYLGYVLDETMLVETVALSVTEKNQFYADISLSKKLVFRCSNMKASM